MLKNTLLVIILLFGVFVIGVSGQTPPYNKEGATIETRFLPPQGYERKAALTGSFSAYLRNLPLKPDGALVKYYDGRYKNNAKVYIAVVDMDISPRDLQQCADAVMRLYGEYQYCQKKYYDIKFNFVSDGKPRYYKDYAKGDYSYAKFLKYMDYIFAYANTSSLFDQTKAVKNIEDMQPGDTFIQKGRPYGHAVIVVDMAVNKEGKKVYMLAQSYMPAQETQILLNPMDPKLSPWYEVKEGSVITPEWSFEPKDLRRF